MTLKHKVFLSYYHKEDEDYRDRFEQLFDNVIVSRSVNIGDIDPNANTEYVRQRIRDEYLSDSTVTVVLVGTHTWQRKYVDWEIYSSLRDTPSNSRSGLVGILLPTYPGYEKKKYNYHTIPPRLWDNIKEKNDGQTPFSDIYLWTDNQSAIQNIINQAFEKRVKINPINTRLMFRNNRSTDYWED
jgi:hypothetical protein